MGERNSPDSGETTLAAATAAIITARWQQTSVTTGGGNGGAHSANGHGSGNGHATNGVSPAAYSEWSTPLPPAETVLPPVAPAPAVPVSPAPTGPAPIHQLWPAEPAGAPAWTAEPTGPPAWTAESAGSPAWTAESAGSHLRPPEPTGAPAWTAESAGSPAWTAESAGSHLRPSEPAGSHLRPPEPAGSAFFSAAHLDPVPEVFDARVPGPRDGGGAPRDLGGFHDAVPEEVRTQVPPGFERRNFGPIADGPAPPAPGGSWGLADAPAEAPDRPAPEPTPSALLGVVPPPAWTEPTAAPSLAPPEPAPWVDSGWTDFAGEFGSRSGQPGGEPDPGVLVGAGVGAASSGGGRAPLPRRVPQVPDVDFPLFASDPAEPTPDPATERFELNRIADYLRDEAEALSPNDRPDAVDLESVLAAVRQVPEVRDAQLRWNAQAGQTLRIEFVDGVDESEITRSVVRLLRSRLGLAAQPSFEEPTVDSPYRGRVSVGTARVPSRVAPPSPGGRALPGPSGVDSPRLILENVTVTRLGAEATVEVRLRGPGRLATVGEGRGPGVDAYLSRLAATAAGHAVDQALAVGGRARVFIEHVSVVPFGVVEVAVVVLLLAYDGVTEQLSGSAIVGDDPHHAVARATLAALNRRLESLL